MKEARAHLEAGAHIMMLESEGITEGLPPNKWRTDVIKRSLSQSLGLTLRCFRIT
jgi:hypothetical protein